MIHTVKGFSVVNKAEVDIFLKERQWERNRYRDRQRCRDRDTEREGERNSEKHTYRERDRQTDRHRKTVAVLETTGEPGRSWNDLGRQRTIWKDTRWYPTCIDGAAVGQLWHQSLKNPIRENPERDLNSPHAETNVPKQTISLPPGALPHCPSGCSSYEIQFWLLIVKNPALRNKCWVKRNVALLLAILGWKWTYVSKNQLSIVNQGARAFKEKFQEFTCKGGRDQYTQLKQLSWSWSCSGLVNITLIILRIVNLQLQSWFVPISLRPVLGIVQDERGLCLGYNVVIM